MLINWVNSTHPFFYSEFHCLPIRLPKIRHSKYGTHWAFDLQHICQMIAAIITKAIKMHWVSFIFQESWLFFKKRLLKIILCSHYKKSIIQVLFYKWKNGFVGCTWLPAQSINDRAQVRAQFTLFQEPMQERTTAK